MPPETLDLLLTFFKALADETRLRVLGLLATREYSVEEIAATLEVREPTVSHHLGKLKELNLVTVRADGNTRHYKLNADALRELSRDVLTPETIAQVATRDLDTDRFERKVLQAFTEGGRIREIPMQRKKRDVLLKWLISHFAPGRRYAEPEVNAILKRFTADTATWRREFIMTGLMERSDGVAGKPSEYWRLPE